MGVTGVSMCASGMHSVISFLLPARVVFCALRALLLDELPLALRILACTHALSVAVDAYGSVVDLVALAPTNHHLAWRTVLRGSVLARGACALVVEGCP